MKNMDGVEVEMISCDNAGENKELEKAMKNNGFKTRFEYTAADTPQQNGVVERKFATLFGRIRAMMIHCKCPEELKYKLWAEGANITTMLDNIFVANSSDLSPFDRFYDRQPTFLPKLRTFGEIGVVLDRQKMKNKLATRGHKRIFVG